MRALFLVALVLTTPEAVLAQGSRNFVPGEGYGEIASAVVTAAPLTMACWMHADTTVLQYAISIGINLSIANDYFQILGTVGPEQIVAQAAGAGFGTAFSSNNWTAGQWHYVGGAFHSASSRFAYLDGVRGPENTSAQTPAIGGFQATRIARSATEPIWHTTDAQFAGCTIWDEALDQVEMNALSIGYLPEIVHPSGIVRNFRMQEPVKTDALVDASGNGDMPVFDFSAGGKEPDPVADAPPIFYP